MADPEASPALTVRAGAPTHPRSARNPQCNLLRPSQRLRLAHVAAGFSPLPDGLLLLPEVAQGWDLGKDPRNSSRPASSRRGTRGQPQRGDSGQPNREDHGKRGSRGYDAGKKIQGRKRHILVDTLGLLLICVVHAANVQDRDGAKLVLEKVGQSFPRLQRIWADGGYAGQLVDWVKGLGKWVLEIVKRSDSAKGFEVLPHRWIVERTFGWLGRHRRLSKDYEVYPETSEALIRLAMIRLMVRRLALT